MASVSSGDDKDLNFELNIMPVLDILSVLICFLLLSAVWVQIGTIDTRQAIGDNSASGAENPPSLVVMVDNKGGLQLQLKDLPNKKTQELSIGSQRGTINWMAFEQQLGDLKNQWPELKTSVVMPEAKASYGDVIKIMDKLKQFQFEGVGLSPLG